MKAVIHALKVSIVLKEHTQQLPALLEQKELEKDLAFWMNVNLVKKMSMVTKLVQLSARNAQVQPSQI